MAERNCCLKKKLICLLAFFALAFSLCTGVFAVGPAAASEAYVVMDADTGQVLLSSNMDVRKNPASITKIMTMGLACQKAQGDWSASLTVSHDAVYSLAGTGSSHIALMEDEQVTLEQMLYAAELVSANDASNVLAEYIGGSIQGGVDAMNAQAAALGLQNTHFSNPHGLTDSEHYVSAYDMARILYWALQQPGFEELFRADGTYTMPATNLQSEQRYFSQKDYIRLAGKAYAYVPTVVGSKTGYTDEARYTYACLAEKDGVRLICVVLHSQLRTDKFDDVEKLLDYAFTNFHKVEIPAGQQTLQLEVRGGGDPLGRLSLSSPALSMLVYGDRAADEITVTIDAPSAYVLGQDCAAQAVYALDGQGVQESAALTVPLTINGLEALLERNRGLVLPTSGDVEAAGVSLPALLAVAAVCLVSLWLLFSGKGKELASRGKKRRS